MKKIALSFVSMSLSALAISSCASWNSDYDHADNHSPIYQQCNGIRRQLVFVNNSLHTNNIPQIQVDQQRAMLQQQYTSLDCDAVLSGKMPSHGSTVHEGTPSQAAPTTNSQQKMSNQMTNSQANYKSTTDNSQATNNQAADQQQSRQKMVNSQSTTTKQQTTGQQTSSDNSQ